MVRGHRALAFLDKKGGQGPLPWDHHSGGMCVPQMPCGSCFSASGTSVLQLLGSCPFPVVLATGLGHAGDLAREASFPDALAHSQHYHAKLWCHPPGF